MAGGHPGRIDRPRHEEGEGRPQGEPELARQARGRRQDDGRGRGDFGPDIGGAPGDAGDRGGAQAMSWGTGAARAATRS